MIELIFTIDYEIYGNGEGSLKQHIFEPTRQLKKIFDQHGLKLVIFVEAVELEIIEAAKSDFAISEIKQQIKDFYQQGHEIALHLHPQWSKGKYRNGKWELNDNEYNLCVLPQQRIAEIVQGAIKYLRIVLLESDFSPFSFRAGNWLFQPTQPAASILAQHGIKIDSSVFKGGLQHQHHLDYRPAINNGYFWKFQDDVNKLNINGKMIEIPIYAEMVPPWKMATKKRLGLQKKAATGRIKVKDKLYRLLDIAHPLQPLKLDFCRMTIKELTGMMNTIIQDDERNPQSYKPIVAIGHTKDLVDLHTVELFLLYIKQKGIKVSTLQEAYINVINNST